MPEALSYYDTAPLRATLERLVDFDLLNAGATRFSVGAVNVRTGNFVYFDSTTHRIGPEHVIASGSLPPGFPATEIEGELYWDGGLVSNTPLQWVLDSRPRCDTLAFQVDLWSARGELPRDLIESEVRAEGDPLLQPDPRRDRPVQARAASCAAPFAPDLQGPAATSCATLPEAQLLAAEADDKVYNIIHLIYRSQNYEGVAKDYEFSRRTMEEHWQAGYHDAVRTLRHPEVLQRPTEPGRRVHLRSRPCTAANDAPRPSHHQRGVAMNEAEVRERAFAMPLTSPAFPIGPYRFVDREYLIITYRTDPAKLRALVPEPLEIAEPLVKFEFIRMPEFDRLRRLHRERPGDPGLVPGRARAATPTACSWTTIRRSPAAASCGAFPRSWPSRRCGPRSTRWSARSTTARCASPPGTMGYKHKAADLAAVAGVAGRRRTGCSRSSRMSTARARICELVEYYLEDVTLKGAWTGPAALEPRPARAGAGGRAAGAGGRLAPSTSSPT